MIKTLAIADITPYRYPSVISDIRKTEKAKRVVICSDTSNLWNNILMPKEAAWINTVSAISTMRFFVVFFIDTSLLCYYITDVDEIC